MKPILYRATLLGKEGEEITLIHTEDAAYLEIETGSEAEQTFVRDTFRVDDLLLALRSIGVELPKGEP